MKVGRIIVFVIFLCSHLNGHAQKEQLEWIFGSSGVGFRYNPNDLSTSVTNGNYTPYTREGCSVVSNPVDGNLLFYTDGISVLDANHQLMPNGGNLFGNVSSSQSGIVCVKPGSCNQFYVFYNDRVAHEYTGGSLYYSVVDLSLKGNGAVDSPTGDVLQNEKNKFIIGNSSEAMMLIADNDESRFWLISPEINSDKIRVFVINETGVMLHSTFNSGFNLYMARSLRYSIQNKKIALISSLENDPSILLDFDPKNGVLTNPVIIPGTPLNSSSSSFSGFYDAEFSEDGSKLYLSRFHEWQNDGGKLYQYDLDTPEQPIALIYKVSNSYLNHSSGLKRGPDNKIYHLYLNTTYNDKRMIGVINEPNEKGVNCNYNPTGINLGKNIPSAHKFPEFLKFTNLDFLKMNGVNLSGPFGADTLMCDGETLILDAKNDGATYLWNDGTSGSKMYVDQSGLYYVEIKDECAVIYDSINVSYISPPFVNLGEDTVLCFGTTLFLNAYNENSNYLWHTGSQEPTISISNSGEYILTVENKCGISKDSIEVDIIEKLQILFEDSYNICDGEILNLSAENENATYFWDDGKTTSTQIITEPGLYSVTVSNKCESLSKSTIVTSLLSPVASLGPDTIVCFDKPIKLKVDNDGFSTFIWINGYLESEILVSESGEYTVIVENRCGSDSDTVIVSAKEINLSSIPNVITPNQDSYNDSFVVGKELMGSRLRIINRWGDTVYYSNSYQNNWSGEGVNSGTYYYTITNECLSNDFKGFIPIAS